MSQCRDYSYSLNRSRWSDCGVYVLSQCRDYSYSLNHATKPVLSANDTSQCRDYSYSLNLTISTASPEKSCLNAVITAIL